MHQLISRGLWAAGVVCGAAAWAACYSAGAGSTTSNSPTVAVGGGQAAAKSCPIKATSTLPGVRIEFSSPNCKWSLEEVRQGGIEVEYVVHIEEEISGARPMPRDVGRCGRPGPSGLILFEHLEGNGRRYCLCDIGFCAEPSLELVTLHPGEYPGVFQWEGREWDGPSDTIEKPGEWFPVGDYTLTISAVGERNQGGEELWFETKATMEIQIAAD